MTGRKLGLRKRIGLRLFSDLYAEKIAEHKLRTLFWECTLRCNLACRHCGSDCRVDPGVPDMPLADFLKVLDEEVTPHNRPEGGIDGAGDHWHAGSASKVLSAAQARSRP